jgi:hypothetical protein
MVAQGLDGNQALLLLQPSLQTLWELQQDFGYAVDDSTQALIDQAREQGIVGEGMRDVQERILRVLERIAEVLGAEIPDAARRAADSIPENPFADWQVPDIRVPDIPGAESFHGGGMVERMHEGMNWVRAHSGLMVDEVPAILQTGEAVLNRRESWDRAPSRRSTAAAVPATCRKSTRTSTWTAERWRLPSNACRRGTSGSVGS